MKSGRAVRWLALLAFAAVFALAAGFVFWGTWSLDFAPVMPDNAIAHAPDWAAARLRTWLADCKFAPGDLLVFLGGPYFWQELKYVFAAGLAALGLAYFCRGRGLTRTASYGAGLLLAFSGYWLSLFSAGHYGWFQWMTYGVFAFGLTDRALARNRPRHWLMLGATLAWGSFYQPDLWLLFTVFSAAYFAFRAVCVARDARGRKLEPRSFWLPRVRGAALALAAFVIIGLPGFRSALGTDLAARERQIAESAKAAHRADTDEREERWIFTTNWSLPPAETAEFCRARLHGDTSCPLTLSLGRRTGVKPYEGELGRAFGAKAGNYRQHSLYCGLVTCLLALVGALAGLCGRHRRETAFFLVGAVLFACISFGRYFEPLYRLVWSLPFGDYLRAPVKWHHLTEFCLAALAAYGLDFVDRALAGKFRYAAFVAPLAVVLGVADLARVDRLYCAPVNVRAARAAECDLQLTVLRKQDFANPQIAALARAGKIVSQANYLGNPELYVVGVLQPFSDVRPDPASPGVLALGILSLAASLGVLTYGVLKS